MCVTFKVLQAMIQICIQGLLIVAVNQVVVGIDALIQHLLKIVSKMFLTVSGSIQRILGISKLFKNIAIAMEKAGWCIGNHSCLGR